MTKHMTHIPLKDMEATINRPIEERQQEAAKRGGRVLRPMNSFMLYRSAYSDRVKALYKKENHQMISQITGDSWQIETEEVKEMFTQLATKDKLKHQLAHPGYKFAPFKLNNRSSSPSRRIAGTRSNSDGAVTAHAAAAAATAASTNTVTPFDSTEVIAAGDRPFDTRASPPFTNPESSFAGSYDNSPWTMPQIIPRTGLITPPEPTPFFLQGPGSPSILGTDDPLLQRAGLLSDLQYDTTTDSTLAGLPRGSGNHDLLQPSTTDSSITRVDPQLLTFSSSNNNNNSDLVDNDIDNELVNSGLQYMLQHDDGSYSWPSNTTTTAPPLTPSTSNMLPYQTLDTGDIDDGKDLQLERWFEPYSLQ